MKWTPIKKTTVALSMIVEVIGATLNNIPLLLTGWLMLIIGILFEKV